MVQGVRSKNIDDYIENTIGVKVEIAHESDDGIPSALDSRLEYFAKLDREAGEGIVRRTNEGDYLDGELTESFVVLSGEVVVGLFVAMEPR